MTAIAITASILALALALAAHVRATRLAGELDHVRRTSRANADRSEELVRALREELRSSTTAARKSTGNWFSPRMTIADALKLHEGVRGVLASMHIGGCSGCSASSTETLEQAAAGHGVELGEMLSRMNALMEGAGAPAAAPPASTGGDLAAAAAALPPPNGGRVMLAVGRVDS